MSVSIQKANFWKRISAWMFDAILTIMLAMGFCLIAVNVIHYDDISNEYRAHVQQYYEEYGAKYGVDLSLSQEDYDAMDDREKQEYNEKKAEAEKEMNVAMGKDKVLSKRYSKVFGSTLLIIAVGALASHLILHFAVPVLFKNGQTLGKKIFGIAVMRTNCMKVSTPVLFIRSVVGLYMMETMVPLFMVLMIYFGYLGIIGTAMIFLLMALQIGVMIKTTTNSSIHDLLTDTMVVDFASQRIFDTEEELTEYLAEQKQLSEANEAANV